MLDSLSDERTGLSFTIFAGLRRCSHSRARVPRDPWPYFTVSDSRLPQTWRDRSPIYTPTRNRVAQLYPQTLGSLFVASCNSQGYGGGIRTRLHTGVKDRRVDGSRKSGTDLPSSTTGDWSTERTNRSKILQGQVLLRGDTLHKRILCSLSSQWERQISHNSIVTYFWVRG
jgi:hypothetical protein